MPPSPTQPSLTQPSLTQASLLKSWPTTLVCPATRLPLEPCSLAEAEARVGHGRPLVTRRSGDGAVGPTATVLARADDGCAYPIVDGIPVLLAPERLVADDQPFEVDLTAPQYAEAYQEMQYYNDVARRDRELVHAVALPEEIRRVLAQPAAPFPASRRVWLDGVHESVAQWEAYEYLTPLEGKRVLQIGGKGTNVIKFLLAGAAEGWLVSPMISELAYARSLAERCGVADRFFCVAGVAEELPFPDGYLDAIYAGSCVHHMVGQLAAREFVRTLKPGGRFSAIDPWRAPLYAVGTKILGKREREVHCQPMTPDRIAPFQAAFRECELVHHGALTRYPLLALEKFGFEVQLPLAWRLMRIDDWLCGRWRRIRGWGSCVSLRAAT